MQLGWCQVGGDSVAGTYMDMYTRIGRAPAARRRAAALLQRRRTASAKVANYDIGRDWSPGKREQSVPGAQNPDVAIARSQPPSCASLPVELNQPVPGYGILCVQSDLATGVGRSGF